MKLIKMGQRAGHTYDYQDKEQGMFKNQSYQKLQIQQADPAGFGDKTEIYRRTRA